MTQEMTKEIAAGSARFVFEERRLEFSYTDGFTLNGGAAVCTNPECTSLHFVPESQVESAIFFDCSAREISCDAPSQHELIENLNSRMSDIEWSLLAEVTSLLHKPLVSPFLPAEIRSMVPLEDLKAGLMVPFSMLFPFANSFVFALSDAGIKSNKLTGSYAMLSDSYCVVPSCSCNDCAAQVFILAENGKEETQSTDFRLDLNNCRITKTYAVNPDCSAETALKLASDRIPGLLEKLRLRRKLIRKLVAETWEIAELKNNRRMSISDDSGAVVSRKIGRNERCVCGSGKKFKHCCGG